MLFFSHSYVGLIIMEWLIGSCLTRLIQCSMHYCAYNSTVDGLRTISYLNALDNSIFANSAAQDRALPYFKRGRAVQIAGSRPSLLVSNAEGIPVWDSFTYMDCRNSLNSYDYIFKLSSYGSCGTIWLVHTSDDESLLVPQAMVQFNK